ncbi:MAG: DUF2807 domain-containing protein [Cyclobacteriaceae bacterium]|nr:DUF2807 domain-containing protein [Cyclobacteriaceae bacterium]
MKKINLIMIFAALVLVIACNEEDLGPRQQDKQNYALVDFDRIEAEDALILTINYGENFSIVAEGDRRNLDDLRVLKNGNSLQLSFNQSKKRQYETSVTITMPVLNGISLSGASNARIAGYANSPRMDFSLSGASLAQVTMNINEIHFNLTGASQLRLQGQGQLLDGSISGASILTAFDFVTKQASLIVSGASNGKVSVADELKASVSGASVVLYRGTPKVVSESTGSSVVKQD